MKKLNITKNVYPFRKFFSKITPRFWFISLVITRIIFISYEKFSSLHFAVKKKRKTIRGTMICISKYKRLKLLILRKT